jgi:hypothetical protein
MAEHLFISAYIPCFSEAYHVTKLGPAGFFVKSLRGDTLRNPTCQGHVQYETAAMIPCGGVFGLVMIWWLNWPRPFG